MPASSFTVAGEEVNIPVEVRDASAAVATYLVPAHAAQDVVAHTGLEVAEPLPGRAVCSLACIRYVDSDLGPYHELGIAFLVRHKEMDPASSFQKAAEVARGFMGAYIHHLPVNQVFTLEAGRSIWGFPKFLADIELDFSRPTKHARLRHDGELVLDLTVKAGVRAPRARSSIDAYSFTDGALRRTAWSLEPKGTRARPGGAVLALGDHPIAKELRSLGLPRRALTTATIDHMVMRFNAPEVA